MTHIEKLDKMLEYIAVNHERRNRESRDIYKHFEDILPENEIPLIIEKLEKDGYIKKIISDNPNSSKIFPPYNCILTHDGFLFFDRGGYESEKKSLTSKRRRNMFKTTAIVANAIIIISISLFSVYVSYDSNKKDETIKEKDKKIEILSAKVDSLTTKQKLNNTTENQTPSP